MKIITLLILFAFSINIAAQDRLNDSLLKQDFDILTTAVAELSPNLDASEKEALYTYLNSRRNALTGQTMDAIAFFKFLIETKANTKMDEHGSLTLSNQVMKDLLSDKNTLFPIPVIIMNDNLLVNYGEGQIPYGSVISKINGIPISALIDDLLKEETTFALRNLESKFDVLYLIKYGAPKSFEVAYTLPNSNDVQHIVLDPINVTSRENIYRQFLYPFNHEQLKNLINTYYFQEYDTYYLQLNNFSWDKAVKNQYEAFDNAFSELFKNIKKQNPKHLIIDLRYNPGGDMFIPGLFYSYIAQDDFTQRVALRVPDFELPYKEYIVKIAGKNTNPEGIETFLTDFQKPFTKQDGYFEAVFIDNKTQKPNKKAFTGAVYLLVGGRTFSAATYYTALFKQHNRGYIVGEPIGGSHHDITAGVQMIYELPNTKIELSIPIGILKFSQDLEVTVPEKKIVPDLQETESAKYDYFLKKEDWDLQTVFKNIQN